MSLYGDQLSLFEEEKKPTLKQYLKEKKGKNRPKQFLVVKVWLPNRYPSFSLETEHFRATVGVKSPFGQLLQQNLEELEESTKQVMLKVEELPDGKLGFLLVPGKGSGFFRAIGNGEVLGFEWKTS